MPRPRAVKKSHSTEDVDDNQIARVMALDVHSMEYLAGLCNIDYHKNTDEINEIISIIGHWLYKLKCMQLIIKDRPTEGQRYSTIKSLKNKATVLLDALTIHDPLVFGEADYIIERQLSPLINELNLFITRSEAIISELKPRISKKRRISQTALRLMVELLATAFDSINAWSTEKEKNKKRKEFIDSALSFWNIPHPDPREHPSDFKALIPHT